MEYAEYMTLEIIYKGMKLISTLFIYHNQNRQMLKPEFYLMDAQLKDVYETGFPTTNGSTFLLFQKYSIICICTWMSCECTCKH